MTRKFALAAAILCVANPLSAQQLLTEYSAYIGAEDLRNSNGVALSDPWQVVRQDRANVHRFGIRQPGDDVDPFFGDVDARAQLEALIRAGFISPAASEAIMRGDVRLRVRVFGAGGVPARVEVEVWNESAAAPSTVVPTPTTGASISADEPEL